jgi:hypothetical protein
MIYLCCVMFYLPFMIHYIYYIGVCSGILANPSQTHYTVIWYVLATCEYTTMYLRFYLYSNKNMRTWQNISPSRTQYLDREMTEILQVYTLDTYSEIRSHWIACYGKFGRTRLQNTPLQSMEYGLVCFITFVFNIN